MARARGMNVDWVWDKLQIVLRYMAEYSALNLCGKRFHLQVVVNTAAAVVV